MELDKFEPFETEFDVENRSDILIKDNKYWAAIVFNDSVKGLESGEYPSHLTYKIRMNTDKVCTMWGGQECRSLRFSVDLCYSSCVQKNIFR